VVHVIHNADCIYAIEVKWRAMRIIFNHDDELTSLIIAGIDSP